MELSAALMLVIVFFLMLAYSVPVSYSIIASALITIIAFLTPTFGMFVSAQKIVGGMDSFTLLAVPFFILAASPEGLSTWPCWSWARFRVLWRLPTSQATPCSVPSPAPVWLLLRLWAAC